MDERTTKIFLGSGIAVLVAFAWLWWDTGVKLGQYSSGIQANAENIAANKSHLNDSRKMVMDGQESIERSIKTITDRDRLLSNVLDELKESHKRQDRILLMIEQTKKEKQHECHRN